MKECNKCGTDNTDNSRFCKGCGYELPKPVQVEQPVVAPPPRKSKKKLYIGIGIVAVLAIITSIGFGVVYAGKHFLKSEAVMDAVLTKMADETNKTCPVMLDHMTRLDGSEALPGKILQSNYTLLGISKEQVDTIAFKAQMAPQIANGLKITPQGKILAEAEARLYYVYKTENGEYLCKITIEPEQYKN